MSRLGHLIAVVLIWLAAGAGPARPVLAQAPPPEKVNALLELLADPEIKSWLERKGNADAAAGATSSEAVPTLAGVVDSVRSHIHELVSAASRLPAQLRRARAILLVEFQSQGLFGLMLLTAGFLAAGFGADKLVRWLMTPYRRWMIALPMTAPLGRLRSLGARAVYGLALLLAFTIASAGFFLIFDWPPLLKEIVLGFLTAAIVARLVIVLARIALVPPSLGVANAEAMRVAHMTDESAQHWYRYSCWIAIYMAFVGVTFSLLKTLGFDDLGILVLAVPVDIALLLLALSAVWLRPKSLDGADNRHATVSWLATACLIALWTLRTAGAMISFWLLFALAVLPPMVAACHRMVHYFLRPPDPGVEGRPFAPVTVAAIDRGIRVALILGAAFFLARAWGLELESVAAGDTTVQRVLRGLLKAAVILLAADFGWSLVKALISRRLGEVAPGQVLLDADPRQARLKTLLPIVQNMLLVVLAVIATLMTLASIGIDIGPLVAGAGIAGVAIGFGAQTIVKDVISGMFFLFDDAFRVGEYIQSGEYKGTVESFSLRSIKLRHHRGPLFTVPFSELGAVQNMSRDWVIEKISIGVTYDTDLTKVKQLVKQVGKELASDPEYGPHIIEPLKMQGVEQFGDFAIELRFKIMTKPGEAQFTVKRRALALMKRAFDQNGIKFAFPTVQVAGDTGDAGEEAVAAASKVVPAEAKA